jgi:uncharacterized protein involved in exopolysaccharide biosynthesis
MPTHVTDEKRENVSDSDSLGLFEMLEVLWDGKWLVLTITTCISSLFVLFALSLPNIYQASALVAPAETSEGGLSRLMNQYGGLAGFAGISMSRGEEGSRTQLGIQILQSRSFIMDFVERRQILPELMASKTWDPSTGKLSLDEEIFDVESGEWIRDAGDVSSSKPSSQDAYKALRSVMEVTQSKITGYVTISVEHKSPVTAALWVDWLIEDVNSVVRRQDVEEATKSIEYLKQQIASTPLADLQKIFFELIQTQMETIMLAEVRPEYVFKVIDPAVIPEEKSKPSRSLISLFGLIIGTFISITVIFIKAYFSAANGLKRD